MRSAGRGEASRTTGVVSIATLVAALSILGAEPASAQSNGDAANSTRDGIYTEAQAKRGKEIYGDVCSRCHPTSRFEGTSFMPSWSGAPVSTLYTVVRTQMPFDNPGSLDREEYAAVLAYIFRLNGFPTGQRPLPASSDSLTALIIESSSGQ